MPEKDRASPQTVRLSYDDHEWLAKLAQDENLSVRAMVKRAVRHFRSWHEGGQDGLARTLANFESERQLRRHYQRKYQLKSRRLHNALRDVRNLRASYESQLSDERKLRVKRESKLRDERDLYSAGRGRQKRIVTSCTVPRLPSF